MFSISNTLVTFLSQLLANLLGFNKPQIISISRQDWGNKSVENIFRLPSSTQLLDLKSRNNYDLHFNEPITDIVQFTSFTNPNFISF